MKWLPPPPFYCLANGFTSLRFATRFDEKPDYAYLKTMFKELFIKSGFEMDYIFDWNIVDEERKKDKQEKEKQTQ